MVTTTVTPATPATLLSHPNTVPELLKYAVLSGAYKRTLRRYTGPEGKRYFQTQSAGFMCIALLAPIMEVEPALQNRALKSIREFCAKVWPHSTVLHACLRGHFRYHAAWPEHVDHEVPSKIASLLCPLLYLSWSSRTRILEAAVRDPLWVIQAARHALDKYPVLQCTMDLQELEALLTPTI